MMDKSLKQLDKSQPLGQFQSTPNSNNTTGLIVASRDQTANKDNLGANHTYRSENQKNVEQLTADQNPGNKM